MKQSSEMDPFKVFDFDRSPKELNGERIMFLINYVMLLDIHMPQRKWKSLALTFNSK